MALQLSREVKGIEANYWKIMKSCFDVFSNKTTVTLSLFLSKEARLAGLNNELTSTTFTFEGFKTIAESYAAIKESKIGSREKTPAVYKTETKIADGTIPGIPEGTEYQVEVEPKEIITPAVMEDYETNPFTSAIDC